MSRERTGDGQYDRKYGKSDVMVAFENAAVPILTSSEVADAVGCSKATARRRLRELADSGELYRKKAGARAVVYARLEDGRTSGYGEWKQSLWSEE